jgi:hypothetical protein
MEDEDIQDMAYRIAEVPPISLHCQTLTYVGVWFIFVSIIQSIRCNRQKINTELPSRPFYVFLLVSMYYPFLILRSLKFAYLLFL